MSGRSMSNRLLAKFFGLIAVFCAIAASSTGSEMLGFRYAYEPWTWTYIISWGIAFFLFSSLARFAGRGRVRIVPYDDNQDFILLLRPFTTDNNIYVKNPHRTNIILLPSSSYEEKVISLERLLAQAIEPEYQLRSLGGTPIGPSVVKTGNNEWRKKFNMLVEMAKGIIVISLPGKELLWELGELKRKGYLNKVIFITPPHYSDPHIAEAIQDDFYTSLKENKFNLKKPSGKSFYIYRIDQSGGTKRITGTTALTYKKIRKILGEHINDLFNTESFASENIRLDKNDFIPLQEFSERTGSLEEELVKRIKEGVIRGYMFDGDWHVHRSEL